MNAHKISDHAVADGDLTSTYACSHTCSDRYTIQATMTVFPTYEILIGAEDVYFNTPKALLYISDLHYRYMQSKPDLTAEKTSQLHFDY